MNPQEIPEAYDMSKVEDLGKLSNNLTLEERNALREKFVQEKQTIIYLTQTELSELESTLASENNHHTDRVERVASFLETQKTEGLSLSDMMENNTQISSELKSVLPEIESQAQEFLFGENGYMKQFNLSESSQDRVGMGLSLFILETFAAGEYDVSSLSNPDNTSFFADIETQFQVLKEISDIRITAQGEKNTVLQDPLQAKEIFTQLMVEEADAAQIKAYIEGGNLQPREDDTIGALDISNISQFSQEQLILLQEKITGGSDSGETEGEDSETSSAEDTSLPDAQSFQDMPADEQQSLIERLKAGNFLEKIFASILEALQNLGLYSDGENQENGDESSESTETTGENEEMEEGSNETQKNDILSLFETAHFEHESFSQDVFLQELRGNPLLQKEIQTTLESISPDETYTQSFEHILNSKSSQNIGEVAKAFEAYGLAESFPEGTSVGEKLLRYLQEYALYRNHPQVRGKENGRMTWKEYAQERQQQGWNFVGR